MIVESDVGRAHATAQAGQRAEVQRGGLVALELQPGLRLRAGADGGGFHRGGQGLDGPLVRLLVLLAPGVAHDAVGRHVQAHEARIGLAQRGHQLRLHCRRGHGPGGLVAPQVVEEELAQPLPVDRGHRRAAVVELVHHAPRALVGLVGDAQVRIAQAVLAQVLSGARQDDHARTARIELLRGALGQLHALDDQRRRRPDLFARAAGVRLQRQHRSDGERQQ
ncbi:hypothetical protein D3C71_771710 [compost metagenome]